MIASFSFYDADIARAVDRREPGEREGRHEIRIEGEVERHRAGVAREIESRDGERVRRRREAGEIEHLAKRAERIRRERNRGAGVDPVTERQQTGARAGRGADEPRAGGERGAGTALRELHDGRGRIQREGEIEDPRIAALVDGLHMQRVRAVGERRAVDRREPRCAQRERAI